MEERLHNPCAHNFCLGLLVAVAACHGALPPAAYPVLFQGLCGLWALRLMSMEVKMLPHQQLQAQMLFVEWQTFPGIFVCIS